MARIRVRKSQARTYAPPPDMSQTPGEHVKTPQRVAVFAAKLYAQELRKPIPWSIVCKVTRVAESIQSRILVLKQVRTLYNIPDSGLDPRERKRALTQSDTRVISEYLNDYNNNTLNDRGKPWLDILESAGVEIA